MVTTQSVSTAEDAAKNSTRTVPVTSSGASSGSEV